jgi:hypothetical protein
MKIYINVYAYNFTVKNYIKPENGSRGQKEEACM